MRSAKWPVILASVLVLLVTGCGAPVPIYSVSNAPIGSKSNPSLDDVGKAIQRGGAALGWQMRESKPGHILGTFSIRTHVAVVDINYNTNSFSIAYRDAINVPYDGQNIHPEYNRWVQDLERRIRIELSLL
ncbi:MAG: hypothetical protein ACRD88_04290 [Terriglobia bacterium]